MLFVNTNISIFLSVIYKMSKWNWERKHNSRDEHWANYTRNERGRCVDKTSGRRCVHKTTLERSEEYVLKKLHSKRVKIFTIKASNSWKQDSYRYPLFTDIREFSECLKSNYCTRFECSFYNALGSSVVFTTHSFRV